MIATMKDLFILVPFLGLLLGSIILSFKTRFIQIRMIPRMYRLLRDSIKNPHSHAGTIPAHKALFTAMSTTIGISNIVGPLIAIGLGGPGAMLGFLLATIFGSAATFVEVTYAQKYKDPNAKSDLDRIGGPMHYLNKVFHPSISYLYAWAALILVVIWSGAQANALSAMLEPYAISPVITGGVLSVMTVFVLIGGIERVSDISTRLVPIMFILYSSAMLWIIGYNIQMLPSTLKLIWNSAFTPTAFAGGATGAALAQSLRWGLARGYQSNESGIGTATVPHSMADADSAVDQGILSIVSVFSNGILCIFSGLAVLMTGLYQEYATDNITLITKLFSSYFPFFGPLILLTSATLFVFSTIIGNGYNGTQFFRYALGKQSLWVYYIACALSIFLSSLFSVDAVWTFEDFLVVPVVLPHIIGIVILAYTHGKDLETSENL